MFSKLIASEGNGAGWIASPWAVGVSLAAHVLLLGGLVWAAERGAADADRREELDPEEVTYVDVTQIPEPPEVETEPAPRAERPEPPAPSRETPRPTEPAPGPRQPREAPEEPTAPDEPAGFQELEVPRELSGIPEPRAQEPVDPADYGGRGTPGGRAGGEPPEDAGAGGEGTAEGGPGGRGAGAGGGAGGDGTFVAATVDRQPELTNRSQVAAMLQRLYPERLRNAGIQGNVVVQFVINANGRVEMGSVRILSASNDAFTGPAREVLDDMRFRPARVGGRDVRMLTQMPITFNIQR